MDLIGRGTGVVGLYVQSGNGRSVHFVVTSDGGRRFRPFGPAASNQDIPDSVFFLNSMHGWLATFSGAGSGEYLYRTSDGGRSWQRMRLRAPSGAIFGLPAAAGRTIIETATAAIGRAYSLLTFASRNNGASWEQASVLGRAGTGSSCVAPVSASFPSASAGRAAAFRAGQVVIYRRMALGRPWRMVAELARQPHGGTECVQIQAADSAHAWLQVASDADIAIYATSDGGRSWHRIDRAAEAAGS